MDTEEDFQAVSEGENYTEEEESNSSKGKLGKSDVYQHFDWIEAQKKFKCKHCRKLYKLDSKSTGNLWKHLNRVHKPIVNSWKAKVSNTGEKITDHFKAEDPSAFSQKEFEAKLLDFIILTDQPFYITDTPAYKDFAAYGRPLQNLWGPTTLKRKLIQLYETEKSDIVQKLQDSPGKISLVMDCWSSKNGISFNGIIASWINDNWEYEEVLLDLVVLKGKHSGPKLAESVLRVLEDFQIVDKISTITMDNASNNSTMTRELQRILNERGIAFNAADQHIKCLAHIVNRACKDAMAVMKKISKVAVEEWVDIDVDECQEETGSEVESLGDGRDEDRLPEELNVEENELDSVEDASDGDDDPPEATLSIYHRVQASIRCIRKSTNLREAFESACKIKKVKHKQLVLDNDIRWNTSYFMLNRLLEMREPYEFLVLTEKKLSRFKLYESEWYLLSEMVLFLKPFYKMTLSMSKAKVPNLSLSAGIYINLYNHLESYEPGCGKRQEIIDAAKAACDKLNKYYPDSDGIVYVIGILLNPALKLEWYRTVNIHPDTIKKNKSAALKFWDEKYKPTMEPAAPSYDKDDILMSQMSKRKRIAAKDDFRKYLAVPPVDSLPNNDILLWWKEH